MAKSAPGWPVRATADGSLTVPTDNEPATAAPQSCLTQFVVKPSAADAFKARLSREARTRSATGALLRIAVLQEADAPWRLTLCEVYRSHADMVRCHASPAQAAWRSAVETELVADTRLVHRVVFDWCQRCTAPAVS